MKRHAPILLSVVAVAAVALAQPQAPPTPPSSAFTVLEPPPPSGPRINEYLRYQLERAWAQDESRQRAFSRIRTTKELATARQHVRTKLLAAIGGLPGARTPLNARSVEAIEMPGYRIERIIFESLPGIHVPALVYVPGGPGRHPAVLLACGHAPEGKAFRNYQEIAIRLVRRGYVVLCWDPIGQGERSQFWEGSRQRSRYNLVCGEHAVLGNLAILAGASLARWSVWDGMRAVDYLLTRADVDGARISITGTSGGGFQAATIGALDERIRVVLPSCYLTTLPMRMANRIFEDPDSDPEQDLFGNLSSGIDHAGLLLLVQPRPLMVVAAVKDFVPIEGTRLAFREASALYQRFGSGGRIDMVEGFHEHRFSTENQEAAFSFLDRFNGMPARRGFEPVTVLPADRLRCTRSGQVRVDLPGRSLVDDIREYSRAHRPGREVTIGDRYRAALHPAIEGWPVAAANTWLRPDGISWEPKGSFHAGGVTVDRYLLRHSRRLLTPLLHVHRDGGVSRPVLLDVGLNGKVGPSDWPRIVRDLDEGYDVVSFDVRGAGESRMRYRAVSGDDPAIAPDDEASAYTSPLSGVLANLVYNSLLTGRPYFLEMIEDVEIAARFARVALRARRVVVAGRADGQTLAWAASRALSGIEWRADPGGRLFSWSEAVESGREAWPIDYLMPGGAYLEQPPRQAATLPAPSMTR